MCGRNHASGEACASGLSIVLGETMEGYVIAEMADVPQVDMARLVALVNVI